jgi:basic amino acid/polyamine antiporter, APA family
MSKFEKVLGYRVILLLTINFIIGSGLFFLPSKGVKIAGPAYIISWIILSVSLIYTAMIFAELASMFPKAGGVYEFTKRAYGSFIGFIVGWIVWITGNILTAIFIVGSLQYILPKNTSEFIVLKLVISLLMVLMFNLMAYRGVKTSSIMLITFSLITVGFIILLIISSLPHVIIDKIPFININNLIPFFPDIGLRNIPKILFAIFFISEAFFGLVLVLFLSEETKNPEKTIPKALINGAIIIAFLTISLVFISLIVVRFTDFGYSEAPFSELAKITMGSFGKNIVILGTYLAIMSAAAGWIVAGPRFIVSLTRDNLLSPRLGELHPKYGSPHNAVIFQAIVISIFVIISFLGTKSMLLNGFNEGYEILYSVVIPFVLIIVNIAITSLLILRIKIPDHIRPYRLKCAFIGIPILFLMNLILIITWITLNFVNAIIDLALCLSLIILGIPIYYILQIRYNPKVIEEIYNFLAYSQLIFEKVLLPRKTREILSKLIGPVENKKILDYGCSVGTMSIFLAQKGANVYGVDISKRCIHIFYKRIKKRNLKNIKLMHDHLMDERIHADIPDIDAVISISTLGYIHKIDTILSQLNQRLLTGSQICFMEYDRFFHLITDIPFLKSDALIRHIFRRNGFLVNIERKKTPLWEIVVISGKKVLESYEAQFHDEDAKAIHTRLQPLKDLRAYLKAKLEPFTADVLEKRLSVVLQIDKTLDKHELSVNYHYFEEMIEILYKIIIKYSNEDSSIFLIVKDIGKKVRIDYYLKVEEKIKKYLLNLITEEENHESEGGSNLKDLKQIKELEKMITIGYNGRLTIKQNHTKGNPLKEKGVHTIVKGRFDDEIFNLSEEQYVKISIEIPLTSLEE